MFCSLLVFIDVWLHISVPSHERLYTFYFNTLLDFFNKYRVFLLPFQWRSFTHIFIHKVTQHAVPFIFIFFAQSVCFTNWFLWAKFFNFYRLLIWPISFILWLQIMAVLSWKILFVNILKISLLICCLILLALSILRKRVSLHCC